MAITGRLRKSWSATNEKQSTVQVLDRLLHTLAEVQAENQELKKQLRQLRP
jgi:hypothetical protein